jgi:hypothetical protein
MFWDDLFSLLVPWRYELDRRHRLRDGEYQTNDRIVTRKRFSWNGHTSSGVTGVTENYPLCLRFLDDVR